MCSNCRWTCGRAGAQAEVLPPPPERHSQGSGPWVGGVRMTCRVRSRMWRGAPCTHGPSRRIGRQVARTHSPSTSFTSGTSAPPRVGLPANPGLVRHSRPGKRIGRRVARTHGPSYRIGRQVARTHSPSATHRPCNANPGMRHNPPGSLGSPAFQAIAHNPDLWAGVGGGWPELRRLMSQIRHMGGGVHLSWVRAP